MRQDTNWQFYESGLAVVKITIYPEAYQGIENFDNLVKLLVRMQAPGKGTQSDIQHNPFILTPSKTSGERVLYILANDDAESTICWGLVSDLRNHVQDCGGEPGFVCRPLIYQEQCHGQILSRGFTLAQYNSWALKTCPKYRSPNKVLDRLSA